MPDGKVLVVAAVAAMLIVGVGKIVRVVHPVTTGTKNGVVKVVKHIHPKGAIKAIINHQK